MDKDVPIVVEIAGWDELTEVALTIIREFGGK
jgi:hypothetical protein